MGLAKSERHTVQEIRDLPEGVRMELIDGFFYDMASPTSTHQRIVGTLFRRIADYLEQKKAGCEAFVAPFAVFLHDDDYTYLEPDISVICDKDKVKEDGCHGAPDWVIEVVSDSTRKRDYLIKLVEYDRAGVREYWIVDPTRNRIVRYLLNSETEKFELAEHSFSDTVTPWLYPDLTIDFSQMA